MKAEMPAKGAFTITELVLLLIFWSACQNAWRAVVVGGLTEGVQTLAPSLSRLSQSTVVGVLLLVALYGVVLLASNVTVGRYKAWELTS